MAVEVTSDEDSTEDTGLGQDYPEPDAEPLCWTHHSNSCGCQPEGQEQALNVSEGRFSTEPPFGPDDHPVIDGPLELPAW
ncbi:hypothetical protein [Streptomyces sirii]|uniref:hypothetical protein n=1 Tax=Streptomyces sirii TaxID=3127701 RepID=UPI003D36617C